jgi:hypothetical protein
MNTLRLLLLTTALATRLLAAPAVINPGDPGAQVKFEHAEIVTAHHPELWVASIRASAYLTGHEPNLAIDGNSTTDWRVSGPPPAPMARGNWLEIELNKPATIDHIEVEWLGEAAYDYKVYKKPRDDFREQIKEGRSAGGRRLERIDLPPDTFTRSIRVEFATDANNAPQGIQEIRIGGLSYPQSYPRAADKFAPVEAVRRILYAEFERLPHMTVFDPKLPYADGGSALRLMPRDDAFEGGHAEFTIATKPGVDNWITLKLWESHDISMTARGDLIVVETLDGSAAQRGRTILPEFVTDQQHHEQEWYGGPKPQPGRWSYAHYKLPADVVGNRKEIRLRLQGVGNTRRDYPMRSPAPPVYSITSSTAPTLP